MRRIRFFIVSFNLILFTNFSYSFINLDTNISESILKSSIQEIVVTGQIENTKSINTIQKTIVITPSVIKLKNFQTVSDVLISQSSFKISHDNVLGDGLKIQGLGGQNVKVMIDDVPIVGRLDGNIDLSQISLNNIERIEIIEGPSSVVYGSDALAGTVNIITKKKSNEKINLDFTNFYETVGRLNNSFNFTLKQNRVQNTININRNFFNGWSPTDELYFFPKETLADTNRYKTWKPKESYSLRLQNIIFLKKFNFRTFYSNYFEKITNRGFPLSPYYETAFDEYYFTSRKDFGIDFKYKNKSSLIKTIISYNDYDRFKNRYVKDLTNLNQTLSNQIGDNDSINFSQLIFKSIYNNDINESIKFQLGFDLNRQQALGKRLKSESQIQRNIDFFGTSEILYRNLKFRPGVRIINNSIYSSPIITSSHLLYSKNNLRYRISFSEGFRSPTLKELFFEFIDVNHNITGNPNLVPEKSNNFQSSLTYTTQKNNLFSSLTAEFFYNLIYNKIDLLSDINDITKYTYYNIDTVNNFGISSRIEMSNQYISSSTNLSYFGFKNFKHSNEYNYQFNLSNITTYKLKNNFNLNFFYRYYGPSTRMFYSFENSIIQNKINSYNILDFSINKKIINSHLDFTIGLKNIFNVMETTSNNVNIVHSSNNSVNIGYGRTFFFAANIKL